MKHLLALTASGLLCAQFGLGASPQPTATTEFGPTPIQKALSARGFGMFCHFGINTFNETEWSDGTLPVESYNPKQLDPDQWVRTAKEAGFRHLVLVTKHHDGFCLWPTAETSYNVSSSPVKTDVVRAVSEACKKYGVQFGVYYSLWDRHEPKYANKDPEVYNNFMRAQLTELLTRYGPVCELWFDGAWDKKREDWNVPSIYKLIRKLQPDCAVTINHTIGARQKDDIGQPVNFAEGDAIRFWPVDFRTKDPNLARADDPKHYLAFGALHYLPFEHTICLSDRWNWFQKANEVPARSTDELEELFYWMTANDNAVLLNVTPDQTGRLRQNERQRIFELADRLGIRGGKSPLPARRVSAVLGAKTVPPSASAAVDTSLETGWRTAECQATLEIQPKAPVTFDWIASAETAGMKDLGDGFSQERTYLIQEFAVDAFVAGAWTTLHQGTTVGACRKLIVPRTTADRLRLRILKASQPAGIDNLGVYDSRTVKRRVN